jgi:hypothetical protein
MTGLGLTAYLVDAVALAVNAVVEALGWDLGIPRSNDDFVWH